MSGNVSCTPLSRDIEGFHGLALSLWAYFVYLENNMYWRKARCQNGAACTEERSRNKDAVGTRLVQLLSLHGASTAAAAAHSAGRRRVWGCRVHTWFLLCLGCQQGDQMVYSSLELLQVLPLDRLPHCMITWLWATTRYLRWRMVHFCIESS